MTSSPPELSVIAPCLNEALNVPELAARVLGAFDKGHLRGELVIVDDGSTDETPAVIRALEAAHPGRVLGCFHPKNRGIEQGWRTGITAARAPVVAVIDADLQYQPEDLLRLYRELVTSGVDVVQGYRSQIGRTRGKRYHLSRGFNVLLNGAFGMHLRDNKSGFVMCGKEVFLDLLSHRATYHYWQSFVMVAAHAKGYSYKEVETLFEDRRAGSSFLDAIAYRASARSLVDLAKGFVEYRVLKTPGDVADRFLAADAPATSPASTSWLRRAAFEAYAAALDEKRQGVTRAVRGRVARLERTQWLSAADLGALQDEKLRRMVRHAYRDVPFYRERMRTAGIRPDDVRTRADLAKLPRLTRADLKSHLYFDLLSENHDKQWLRKRTSLGPRGEITSFFVDRHQREVRFAARARGRGWAGLRFGDPHLRITTSLTEAPRPLDRLLAGELVLHGDVLDDVFVRRTANVVATHRPILIEADAEVLVQLATRFEALGVTPGAPPPRAIVSLGQNLDLEARRRVERAFGAPVFDRYATSEVGCVAQECEAHAGLHVNAEGLIVEILVEDRPARPGELGRVVVTDLENFCMPFLRYEVGDAAIAVDERAPCPCGRSLPRIGRIEGRPPLVVGAATHPVPASYLANVVRGLDHAFAAVEVGAQDGRVIVRVARGGRFSQEALDELTATFATALGGAPCDILVSDPPSLSAAAETPTRRVLD